MVAATYFSKFTSGITVFTGFVTNSISQCASPPGPSTANRAELSLANTLCASSPRLTSSSSTDIARFAISYTAPTVVTGTQFQIFIRKAGTKSFWLESYTSAGALSQTTVPVTATGTSIMALVNLTTQSVTVPANGALVLRTACSGGSNRFYFGSNPKGQGLPSAVLTVDEVPAVTGPSASVSGSIGTFTGAASGSITPPITRYYTASVYNGDGSLLTAPLTVGYLDKATGVHLVTTTGTHPIGHPTHAGLGGWLSITKVATPADQQEIWFYVLDQPGTVGLESGMSVGMLPQLTNDGNG